jgi:hypothetical protein
MSWTTAATISGPFALYRGSLGRRAFAYDHTCFAPTLATPAAIDPASPSPGSGFYYLVTVRDVCGESSPGFDSSGSERPLFDVCP